MLDYLDALVWDGKSRLGTDLVRWLGADDSPYNAAVRAASRMRWYWS